MEHTTQKTGRTACQIYTRVMGYYRPVSHFNIGKKAEHYNRLHFKEEASPIQSFIDQYPATDAHSMNTKDNTSGLSG